MQGHALPRRVRANPLGPRQRDPPERAATRRDGALRERVQDALMRVVREENGLREGNEAQRVQRTA